MSKETEKAPQKFSGVVLSKFILGTKKPKTYLKGDTFETKNEEFFNHLKGKNKIK